MIESPVLLDETALYSKELPEEPLESFGDVMSEIQSASGRRLTWQQMASKTGIHRTTLKRIRYGELRPPASVEFIERLRLLPGVTEKHIDRLIRAADAPNWLAVVAEHYRRGNEPEHRVEVVSGDGINLLLGLRMDLKQYSVNELNELSGHMKRQLQGTIDLFKSIREIKQTE